MHFLIVLRKQARSQNGSANNLSPTRSDTVRCEAVKTIAKKLTCKWNFISFLSFYSLENWSIKSCKQSVQQLEYFVPLCHRDAAAAGGTSSSLAWLSSRYANHSDSARLKATISVPVPLSQSPSSIPIAMPIDQSYLNADSCRHNVAKWGRVGLALVCHCPLAGKAWSGRSSGLPWLWAALTLICCAKQLCQAPVRARRTPHAPCLECQLSDWLTRRE